MPGEDANGRNSSGYVTTREFDNRGRQVDRRLENHDDRLDRLEAKWDRYVGPIVLIAGLMTIVATVSNLLVLLGIVRVS